MKEFRLHIKSDDSVKNLTISAVDEKVFCCHFTRMKIISKSCKNFPMNLFFFFFCHFQRNTLLAKSYKNQYGCKKTNFHNIVCFTSV